MMVSLNEIELTLRRAGLGAGWPYGLAEEAGRAAAWLAARGLDGVGAALEALAPGPAETAAGRSADGWRFPAARVAAAGPSAFDLLAADEHVRHVALEAADAPLLLAGYAGIAARPGESAFVLAFSNGGEARVTTGGVSLSGRLPGSGDDVVVSRLAAVAAGRPAPAGGAVEIDDALWARVLALAARSYVPASEASRLRGAGAGLTDND